MEQHWRPVVGYEGYYEVSNDGLVRSVERRARTRCGFRRVRARHLAQFAHEFGYPMVSLNRGGRGKLHLVHRLVAAAFLGSCPKEMEVAHNDGNPRNCTLSNLRYATPTENNRDKVRHGTTGRGERCPTAKLTRTQAELIKTLAASGMRHRDIAAQFSVSQPTVTRVVNGKTWAKA